jgi:hypothetical protein
VLRWPTRSSSLARTGLFIARLGGYKPSKMSARRPVTDRPTVARADRRERERFRAMAVRAGDCPSTADAFAFAYRSLGTHDRVRMARAVARDLADAGDDPGPALAIFLAVEDDPAVGAEIVTLLGRLSERSAHSRARATLFGGSPPRGILVGLPNGGEWVGLFIDGEENPDVKIVHAESFDTLEREAAAQLGRAARRVGANEAAELAAPRLLQHRRERGSLPLGARRFAELFSV